MENEAVECVCNDNGCPSCDGSAGRTYIEHERRAGRMCDRCTATTALYHKDGAPPRCFRCVNANPAAWPIPFE